MHEELLDLYTKELEKYQKMSERKRALYRDSVEHFSHHTKSTFSESHTHLTCACLALAIKSIINAQIISPDHPFYLPSHPRNAAYMWTALMILGAIISDKPFNHHSIISRNPDFNPKSQMGYFATFGTSSVYHQVFMQENTINCDLIVQYLTKASVETEIEQKKASKAFLKQDNEMRQQEQIVRYSQQLLAVAKHPGTHTEDIKRLIRFDADPNIQSPQGETPLMLAATCRNQAVVVALIEEGADPFIKNENQQKALDLAKDTPLFSILKGYELLYAVAHFTLTEVHERGCLADVDINFRSIDGSTALIYAIMKQDFQTACALMDLNADPTLQNNKGETALTLGKACGMQFERIDNTYALLDYTPMSIIPRLI